MRKFEKLTMAMVVCSIPPSCPTICDSMDCSLPDSSVHGISQTRRLEWVAVSLSRGSSRPRDQNCISCLAGGSFTWEAQNNKCNLTNNIIPESSLYLKEDMEILSEKKNLHFSLKDLQRANSAKEGESWRQVLVGKEMAVIWFHGRKEIFLLEEQKAKVAGV